MGDASTDNEAPLAPDAEGGGYRVSRSRPAPREKGGWHIFSFMGIPVLIRPGMILIMAAIGLSLGLDFFPSKYASHNYDTAVFIAMGAAGAFLFFLSILIHEIAHCIFARFNRVPIRRISMFFLGGVSELEHEPRTARSEFAISLAGPAASLILGGALWAVFFGLDAINVPLYVSGVFSFVGMMNIILGVTNLLPGFPLDGGRILRALIWLKTRNFLRATRVASITGRVLGFASIGTGLMFLVSGPFGSGLIQGMLLIMVGMFVERGARESYEQALLRKSLEKVRVADVMRTNLPAVWEGLSLHDVVQGYFMRYSVEAFPVVDHLGRLRGMLNTSMVQRTAHEQWPHLTVGQILPPDVLPPVCKPEETVDDLFTSMMRYRTPALAVVDERSELLGAVMLRDILQTAHLRKHFIK